MWFLAMKEYSVAFVLFWDAPRVGNYETCLSVDKVILKSKSEQNVSLQPCQQIFCMYLFGKRDKRVRKGDFFFFLYVHIYRCVQIVACKASTWSVSLSLSLGLLSYVTALNECKAWSTTKLFNKGAQIVFVIIPTFNKAFPETLQQGDHTYIFMGVSMCLYYWIRACQALEILGEGSYLLETQVSSFGLQSHPQAVRWKLRLGWEFMLKLLF